MPSKGRGIAVGAVVAAGLMLRPVGSPSPQRGGASNAASALGSSTRQESGPGPWIASCNYWAPAREPEEQSPKKLPEVHNTLDATNGVINLHVTLDENSKDKELGCSSEPLKRWGFPGKGKAIKVKAIIATVPDPIHSHFGLIFDRAVDAILQAAAANDYISSYYWLPWKNPLSVLRSNESKGDAEPGHDPERERKPGLIILKHFPPKQAQGDLSDSFYNVVYLFLVAETPTQGVDGFQLQYAFSYEAELESALREDGNQFSRGNGVVSIIGPMFSGSAAPLAAGIQAGYRRTSTLPDFEVSGVTATKLAVTQLTMDGSTGPRSRFLSFGSYTDFESKTLLEGFLGPSGYDLGRVALLVEDNTVYGSRTLAEKTERKKAQGKVQVIRFPREISLLRNAQVAGGHSGNEGAPSSAVPSPFLPFLLKDSSLQDSVPQFSRDNTPVSQEAQLMAIGRQLHRNRTQFVAIVASNILDQVFLAQFLHRACPEVRFVFFGGDQLLVREIDSVPFIGSIAIGPYPLIDLGWRVDRVYPDSVTEALYNAASYTFRKNPASQDYLSSPSPTDVLQRPLWATVIGSDGYYPLAILSQASPDPGFLTAIHSDAEPNEQSANRIYPSRMWVALCALVSFFCLCHAMMLLAADYWSPLTRDLAIGANDQPRRRSMYAHVATAALFSMAVIVSFPAISLSRMTNFNPLSTVASVVVLACSVLSVIVTIWKTWGNIGWASPGESSSDRKGVGRVYSRALENGYFGFNLLAWTMLIAMPVLWGYLCTTNSAGSPTDSGLSLVGLSLSYRCINPASGVSPVVPVLLLLLGWYLWAIFQTWRMRFSENGRPWLPGRFGDDADRLFVSDDDLDSQSRAFDCCLYRKISCLLITREIVSRFWRLRGKGSPQPTRDKQEKLAAGQRGPDDCMAIDSILVVVYASSLVWFCFFSQIRSLDHFLWRMDAYLPSPYEMLVGVLFFPLIVMCLAGCLRMVLIWGALKRGLLDRLEYLPIRFAFSRLKVMGWITMLRHGGVQEQWTDMARSLESMRQMLHQKDLRLNIPHSGWHELEKTNEELLEEIGGLRAKLTGSSQPKYDFMKRIETHFATFSQKLLSTILIPYWKNERTGLVASEEIQELPIKARRSETPVEHPHVPMELHAGPASAEPARILVAEEFLAIRYISLIRAVLTNMRYLMIFVSGSFVLVMLAWNVYPFQPRQRVDWLFTGLLVLLGLSFIFVFAQMHRNPILSRITDSKANELGWDFYLRIFSYGALPVLAWLTYQFPDIGSFIYKFLQPGIPGVK